MTEANYIQSYLTQELEHLAIDEESISNEYRKNQLIIRRLTEAYYKDHLILLNSFPKSGSRIVESTLALLQSHLGKGTGDVVSKNVPASIRKIDPGLRIELLKYFPNGGIYRHHFPPNYPSMHVLHIWQSKYVLLIRHPADLITALFCHLTINRNRKIWPDNIHPSVLRTLPRLLKVKEFGTLENMDVVIYHVITGGYLLAMLNWMVDWLTFRDKKQSTILCYENFIHNRQESIQKLADFLYNTKAVPASLVEDSIAISNSYAESRKDVINQYPRGWTGKVNVWEDYFTRQHRQTYNHIVQTFLEVCPDGKNLLKVYPNLLI